MRFRGRLPLFGFMAALAAAVTAGAADEPAPLLKPITPAGTGLRVRLPVTPGFPKTMSFDAQVPRNKKKNELIDVTVALDTFSTKSYVTNKKLQSWGYDVPKDREFVLPELTLLASQLAPKPVKGRDTTVRITKVKLTVIDDPQGGDGTIFFRDMSLSAATLYLGNERAMEPRLAFGDKFFELTVPAATGKNLGTDDAPLVDVVSSADAKLVPVYGPMTDRTGMTVFRYAAINGQDSYKTANGTVIPVNVAVSSLTNVSSGVVVSMGLARGCKIDVDQKGAAELAVGAEGRSEFVPAKIKELRLAVNTGPGMKAVKDIVIKDLDVVVEKTQVNSYMLIGQKFMDAYFADAVYAGGADGWKLHGRVDPDLLVDTKTRPK